MAMDSTPQQYTLVWDLSTRVQFFVNPDGGSVLEAQYFGDDLEETFGKDELEMIFRLDAANTVRLFAQLRTDHGIASPLQEVLEKAFKHGGAAYLFRKYCQDNGIEFDYKSY